MEHRHGQRKKIELNVIIFDKENRQSFAKTENISSDGLFIKSCSAAQLQEHAALKLAVAFTQNSKQTTSHSITAFVIRRSNKGYAIVFREYEMEFAWAIQEVLATPSLTLLDNNNYVHRPHSP
ncbi:MAG: hypothetical protein GXP08_17370 [Gammaproteobacteria bacterium]|nr:hypothetical protein [Gammaproteobacteria bacterium]